MADEGKVCVCPQCGKKYKLKEGFDAKSFSCKGCGATVWVAGKPPAPAPTSGRSGGSSKIEKKGAGGAAAATSSRGTGRHSASREGREGKARGRHGRSHEAPKKKNTAILLGVGAVVAVGLIIFFATRGSPPPAPKQNAQKPGDTKPGTAASATTTPETPLASGSNTAEKTGATAQPTETQPSKGTPAEGTNGGGEEEPMPPSEGGETTKPTLGNKAKGEKPKSKYDPPATLGHLDSTPPDQRKLIDDLIVVMLDTQAGRDSLEAKAKLAAIGKPAFLPVLGSMAKIRDTIADTDSQEERLIESSLKLADECLREMDGYLEAHEKAPIRPGTEKNYIEYVLRMHYKRWMDGCGSTPLKDMDTMPGPFDASKMHKEGGEDEEEEK